MKRQRKATKLSEDRQHFRKRIQNNDSEDDPGSWGGMGKMQEMFTKDLAELKNNQTEMNNTLEGLNSRITEAEEWINYLEDRWWKSLLQKEYRKKNEKNEDSLTPLR